MYHIEKQIGQWVTFPKNHIFRRDFPVQTTMYSFFNWGCCNQWICRLLFFFMKHIGIKTQKTPKITRSYPYQASCHSWGINVNLITHTYTNNYEYSLSFTLTLTNTHTHTVYFLSLFLFLSQTKHTHTHSLTLSISHFLTHKHN